MLRTAITAAVTLLATGHAMAVTVWELSRVCGDDAKIWCEGVSYGDAMQQCIDANYDNVSPGCQAIADRIRGGEKVSLF